VLPRLALAAAGAGTGVEMTNIVAALLLARCERGGDAVKIAAKLFGTEVGDVVIGGKTLKPRLTRALCASAVFIKPLPACRFSLYLVSS
jgi:hypothetical protein